MSEKIEGGYVGSNITGNAKTATNLQGGALGATPYQTASDTTVFLAGNTTTTKKVLKQTGNGTVSADPIWEQASVNECSDYTSGTWTPVDASGAGLTFTSVVASYEKIGRLVIARCQLIYPTTASAVPAIIGGLPFVVANDSSCRQGFISASGLATLGSVFPLVNTATSNVRNTTMTANLNNVDLSTCLIYATFVYHV